MVWYNYRWIPAVTLIKQIVASGKLGKIFHYRANFLQDWTISPDVPQGGAGTWRLDVEAAGSGVTGDLIAHCVDTAMWINGGDQRPHRDDRDLRQEAEARRDRQDAGGRHRRRGGGDEPFRERLARPVRIDPLRPRPQGALHAGDQRRERLLHVEPARPQPRRVVRPFGRGPAPRLDARSSSPTASIPISASGGCRA